MPKNAFVEMVERVRALTEAEQRQLRDLLNVWLAPPQNQLTEDELAQELLREGILDHVPPPITDLTPYQDRKPVDISGEPLSETVLKERR